MPSGAKSEASADRLAALERSQRAIELKRDGLSYREIADELGCSVSTAYAAVRRGLDKANDRLADEAGDLRDVAAEELDQLTAKLWEKLAVNDAEVLAKVVKELRQLNESRRRLYGLDKPIKVAPTTPDGDALPLEVTMLRGLSDDELELVYAAVDAVERMRKQAAAAEADTAEGSPEP